MSEQAPPNVTAATRDDVRHKGDSRLTPEGRSALLALVEGAELAETLDADGDAMNDMGVLL